MSTVLLNEDNTTLQDSKEDRSTAPLNEYELIPSGQGHSSSVHGSLDDVPSLTDGVPDKIANGELVKAEGEAWPNMPKSFPDFVDKVACKHNVVSEWHSNISDDSGVTIDPSVVSSLASPVVESGSDDSPVDVSTVDFSTVDLLVTQSEQELQATVAEFTMLQKDDSKHSFVSSPDNDFEELAATTDSAYAALVQHDFTLLQASDVGLEGSSSVAKPRADMIVTRRIVSLPGVYGMAASLTKRVSSPPSKRIVPDMESCGHGRGISTHPERVGTESIFGLRGSVCSDARLIVDNADTPVGRDTCFIPQHGHEFLGAADFKSTSISVLRTGGITDRFINNLAYLPVQNAVDEGYARVFLSRVGTSSPGVYSKQVDCCVSNPCVLDYRSVDPGSSNNHSNNKV